MQDESPSQSPPPAGDAAAPGQPAPVPRLPKGRGIKLSSSSIFRILMFATLLAAVILLRKPCSDGIAEFFERFNEPDAGVQDAGAVPDAIGKEFVHLTADMSEEEVKNALRKAGVTIIDDEDAGPRDAGPRDAGPRDAGK